MLLKYITIKNMLMKSYIITAAAAVAALLIATTPSRRSNTSVVIKKTEGRLHLFYDGQERGSYPVALGNCPDVRPKQTWADGCTPEGEYRVLTKFRSNGPLHKVIMSDYPKPTEFVEATYEGRVHPRRAFSYFGSRLAYVLGEPDTSFTQTELGSFSIHGDRMRKGGHNWTPNGSAAMNNEDMDLIFSLVTPGTKIVIEK